MALHLNVHRSTCSAGSLKTSLRSEKPIQLRRPERTGRGVEFHPENWYLPGAANHKLFFWYFIRAQGNKTLLSQPQSYMFFARTSDRRTEREEHIHFMAGGSHDSWAVVVKCGQNAIWEKFDAGAQDPFTDQVTTACPISLSLCL